MTVPTTPRPNPVEWARKHLFRSPLDGLVTIAALVICSYVLYRSGRFVFVTGRWDIVRENLTLFMVGAYDRDELWRPATALVVAGALTGFVAGVVHRRQVAAGTAPPAQDFMSRVTSILARLWPTIVGVALILSLTETITPTLLVLATVAAGIAGRWIGAVLPFHSVVPAITIVLAALFATVWMLVSAVGWDSWGGLMLNVFLAAISIVLCFPFGVMLALGRRSQFPLIRLVSIAYIELFRGVPLIALLLMSNVALGFFLPQTFGIFGWFEVDVVPGSVVRALVVFIMFTAAYVAEIVRGGLQSVPRGQIEAGQAQGMSPFHVTFLIVLPQALRNVIPALVGQFISLFKDTVLAGAAMGFLELLSVSQAVTSQDLFRGQGLIAETLVFIAFIFWVGSFTMSRESQRLETRLGVGTR